MIINYELNSDTLKIGFIDSESWSGSNFFFEQGQIDDFLKDAGKVKIELVEKGRLDSVH